MSRETDAFRLRSPASPRILALLGLRRDATEEKVIAAIEKLMVRRSLSSELPMRVRFWRKRAGLLGNDLAERLGVSAATISGWQRGNAVPDHQMLEQLCLACGTTLHEFWGPLPVDDDVSGDEAPSDDRQAASG